MPSMSRAGFLAAASTILIACNDSDEPHQSIERSTQPVQVYRSMGMRQCQYGAELRDVLAQHLEAAGVSVLMASCGIDGRQYPQECGAPVGMIGIFLVPANQLERAQSAGFEPLANLPAAEGVDCVTGEPSAHDPQARSDHGPGAWAPAR